MECEYVVTHPFERHQVGDVLTTVSEQRMHHNFVVPRQVSKQPSENMVLDRLFDQPEVEDVHGES